MNRKIEIKVPASGNSSRNITKDNILIPDDEESPSQSYPKGKPEAMKKVTAADLMASDSDEKAKNKIQSKAARSKAID